MSARRRFVLALLAVVAVLVLASLVPQPASRSSVITVGARDVVRGDGTYALAGTALSLEVDTSGGLVAFAVPDGSAQILSGTDLRASDYSRWLLCWDATRRRLWFYSGDIGEYVWDVGPTNSVVRRLSNQLSRAELLTMPLAYYDSLGSGRKQSLPNRAEFAAASQHSEGVR